MHQKGPKLSRLLAEVERRCRRTARAGSCSESHREGRDSGRRSGGGRHASGPGGARTPRRGGRSLKAEALCRHLPGRGRASGGRALQVGLLARAHEAAHGCVLPEVGKSEEREWTGPARRRGGRAAGT
jgi:hypothetical protein